MASLEGIGYIKYNGLTFDGPMISSSVNIESVRDESDRTVMFHRVTIQVKAIVTTNSNGAIWQDSETAGSSCGVDPTSGTYLNMMDRIRWMLSQDGKPLIFEDKIFKRFRVNTGDDDTLIDVDFGPRVRVGSIVPIASNKAFEVSWTVVASVGQCPHYDGSDNLDGLVSQEWAVGDVKQLCYAVEWTADHRGYSTRTVSGFLEIVLAPAMTDGIGVISADDYRDRITISMPQAFRRRSSVWRLNEKRDRINFQVTDEEIPSPNPFPPGVTDIEISHEISIGEQAGWTQGRSVISGFCEVANPLPTSVAWERIYPILDTRISAARAAYGGILLTGIRVTEHLFARRVDFSISFYKLSSSPYGFLKSSGMFTATEDNWSDWRKTMFGEDENTNGATYSDPETSANPIPLPWSRRAAANLSFEPSDDVLITPCTAQPVSVTVHNQRAIPFPMDLQSALRNVCPLENKSYLLYRSRVNMTDPMKASFFAVMEAEASGPQTEEAKLEDGTATPYQGSEANNARVSRSDRNSAKNEFTLHIRAARVGFPPESPKIMKQFLDDVKITKDGSKGKYTVQKILGCRVYMQEWDVTYVIGKPSKELGTTFGEMFKKIFATVTFPNGDQSDIEDN